MSEELVKVKDVWKEYLVGEMPIQAIRDMSLTVTEGEFICLLGPSGSGKTTLINLIGCIDVPDRGDIYFESKNITHIKERERTLLRRDKIGFLFQAFNLLPQLTAVQNVALQLRITGKSRRASEEKARETLREVGLENRLNHLPSRLSGGEKQRVALARAICKRPILLLADEPTGNVDHQTGMQIGELLKTLNSGGTTIILVTHDSNLSGFARKKYYIVDGQLKDESDVT